MGGVVVGEVGGCGTDEVKGACEAVGDAPSSG